MFKALADPSRRELLDRLDTRNGQTLSELCTGLGIARQSVSKHLGVLEEAGLVVAQRRGKHRLHFLNAAPINDIADRWIDRYHRRHAQAITTLKHALEDHVVADVFVYSTFINTTPEQVWHALTTPEVMLQYWGVALYSDWKPGSRVRWRDEPDGEEDTVVLEADPPRRLAYTWHNYQPEHAELFGWDKTRLEELRREPLTKATFDIEPVGTRVKLTITHEAFVPGSQMLRAVAGQLPESHGWPLVFADLKTLLESTA